MAAYRTPEGRDPGRLIQDFRPSDRPRVVAAIVLTFAAALGLFSIVWPPRTPGHVALLVAALFLSLVVLVQAIARPPRVRIFEEGVALTGRRDEFVAWSSVAALHIAHGAPSPRRDTVAAVSLHLKGGTKVTFTLALADNEAVIAELRERTREHLEA